MPSRKNDGFSFVDQGFVIFFAAHILSIGTIKEFEQETPETHLDFNGKGISHALLLFWREWIQQRGRKLRAYPKCGELSQIL